MKTIIMSLGVLCAFAIFAHAQDVTKATATLEPKSGSQVAGTVTFTKTGDEVRVVADVQNLKPGKHGIHIHEKVDLSGPNSIIGKSVIVHEKEDDLKTDPAGNSGARFACGVINAAD